MTLQLHEAQKIEDKQILQFKDMYYCYDCKIWLITLKEVFNHIDRGHETT